MNRRNSDKCRGPKQRAGKSRRVANGRSIERSKTDETVSGSSTTMSAAAGSAAATGVRSFVDAQIGEHLWRDRFNNAAQ
jgi:hypothetical protein